MLNYLETLGDNVDVRIITNIPSRFPAYFNSQNGEYMRNTARKNIKIYLEKLNPRRFPSSFASYFNKNLSKIEIGLFCNEVGKVINDKGFQAGFEAATAKLQEYPTCELLRYSIALLLEGGMSLATLSTE